MNDKIDRKILRIFRECNDALPAPVIKFMTKESNHRISERLESMKKYGFIEPVTKKNITFYKLTKARKRLQGVA